MSKINYLDIFKKAWAITWTNKYLWWFGFFLALAGSGNVFNYSTNRNNSADQINQKISDLLTGHLALVITVAIVLLLIFIFISILGIMSRGGLIFSLENILHGKTASFRSGIREGKKYFWRIFMIGFLIGMATLIIIILIATPIVFLFVTKSFILGSLLILAGIIILIPLLILSFFLRQYASIYVAASDLPLIDSLENAYDLFRKNMGPSIVMALLFLPLGIVLAIAMLFALVFLSIILFVIGLLFYLILGKIGAAAFAALAIICLIILFLAIRSIYETFYQTVWLLFFREIASPKVTEKITEAEKETVPEIKPATTPDAA